MRLRDISFLSCGLLDSSFLSCNLHDFFFFLCGHPVPPAAKYPKHIDVAETRLNFEDLTCGDLEILLVVI